MRQGLNSTKSDDLNPVVQEYLNKVSFDEPLSADQINEVCQQIKKLLVEKVINNIQFIYTELVSYSVPIHKLYRIFELQYPKKS